MWLLKIDDETQGRGVAWIEVKKMLRRVSPLEVNQVVSILQKKIKKRLHFAYPTLYKGYNEYLASFI